MMIFIWYDSKLIALLVLIINRELWLCIDGSS